MSILLVGFVSFQYWWVCYSVLIGSRAPLN